MAGKQGQPKYGFGWPDGRLGGLGPPGQREARPLIWYMSCTLSKLCSLNNGSVCALKLLFEIFLMALFCRRNILSI